MQRAAIIAFALALSTACQTGGVETACDQACTELVKVCDFGAFPSFESCVQGCTYDEERGADVVGYQVCVQAAACDTFSIVECEHDFGFSED